MEPTTAGPSQNQGHQADVNANAVALTRNHHSNHSTMSVLSATYATALDVCTTMYGESSVPSDTAAVERFYEASAIYENPVLTATSRSVIADIHALSRQLSAIDVPRPIALICTLFRLQPPRTNFLTRNIDEPLFQALRVWTEIGDICENESFDGHRKTIVEHTLNILILPGIHREGHFRSHLTASSDSLLTNSSAPSSPTTPAAAATPHTHTNSHLTAPGLPVPGTSLTFPSPLHFQLHIITRLSFNEQGHITHHRDFWDVKDVVGLLPGASLAQWIATRLAAKGMSYAASFLPGAWRTRTTAAEQDAAEKGFRVLESPQRDPKQGMHVL